MPSITLRNWQKEAFEAFKKNNYNGILKVGTGKGKTVFAIHTINELLKSKLISKTLIVVPTINLMHQWKKELNTTNRRAFSTAKKKTFPEKLP